MKEAKNIINDKIMKVGHDRMRIEPGLHLTAADWRLLQCCTERQHLDGPPCSRIRTPDPVRRLYTIDTLNGEV